jgi:hypothetical protein
MTIRYLQEQADRAERLAKSVLDAATCGVLMKYARECREKAGISAPFATVARSVHREDKTTASRTDALDPPCQV